MADNKQKEKDPFVQLCPRCEVQMRFYPGCCGNLPLWRCEKCGMILKWQERTSESDRYLILK